MNPFSLFGHLKLKFKNLFLDLTLLIIKFIFEALQSAFHLFFHNSSEQLLFILESFSIFGFLKLF